nr:DUF4388 domain-containing protein [uncultured Holophaga sp.]
MALEGSLRDFDLFSLFNMIKTQGKSGTLVLSRGQEFVKVFFEQGDVVGCDSNQVRIEDRVGAMLVRLGRLSGDELLALIQLQRQTLKRMGTLLLESGKITPQDLQDALFSQAMSVIYRTFRWVEGDYRFDSILPVELDRENFPAIPVDTVLMEAARVMDEWPEVQRRLPDHATVLCKSSRAMALQLDIEQELSGVFDGGQTTSGGSSGLSHEQETVLTYFAEPQSIAGALQITRYDELDTCKRIAELLESGLLEVALQAIPVPPPAWGAAPQSATSQREPAKPLSWFWAIVAILLAAPLLTYVRSGRESLNQGLASLQRADIRTVSDPDTRDRQDWALRLASPADGGVGLANRVGIVLEKARNPVPDFRRLPEPGAPARESGGAPSAR